MEGLGHTEAAKDPTRSGPTDSTRSGPIDSARSGPIDSTRSGPEHQLSRAI